ncbi:Cytidylate kinase [Candidatus Fokinia solitaria]|uniref:(d)CMP kinase n=1 Tax=Candidatus Fokinia solitaria TaxID=1802984 RepID=A0A2U8BRB6_9RICK|nr:(d)CMP kinase [Candidatus Fokinia solitaria]AWD32884.1 Cytidylate kinase [Candidatus Fokinia solitaria]
MNIIAIDGPAASGKGTITSALAKKLDGYHINSGSIYRKLAVLLCEKVEVEHLSDIAFEAECNNLAAEVTHDIVHHLSEVSDALLYTPNISSITSKIAAYSSIRKLATQVQLDMIAMYKHRYKFLLLEGRDAALVAGNSCLCKIFITASISERAKRRVKQLKNSKFSSIHESILRQVKDRDTGDVMRILDPLSVSEDAIVVDSEVASIEEIVEFLAAFVLLKISAFCL